MAYAGRLQRSVYWIGVRSSRLGIEKTDGRGDMRNLAFAVTALVFSSYASLTSAGYPPPSWFDPNEYYFSFDGSMAPTDIDRVTPYPHPQLGGLTPGRQWYAW